MSADVKILDGGMGRELERIGAPFRQPEWSALALMEEPEKVLQAHLNFIEAGAEIITTNSYACVPYHIGKERFDDQGADLIKLSTALAVQAKKQSGKDIEIAGSIPPLFGSYTPDNYNASKAPSILKPLIDEQIDHIDFWLVETIGLIEEALFVSKELAKTDKPVWLAFAIKDGEDDSDYTLFSNETLDKAIRALTQNKTAYECALLNCSAPEDICEALPLLKNALIECGQDHVKLGAYANSMERGGRRRTSSNRTLAKLREELTPDKYIEYACEWQEIGASVIGGCCGIGPDHIRELQALKN